MSSLALSSLLALAATFTTSACADDLTDAERAAICGDGEVVRVGSEWACVYAEAGTECPSRMGAVVTFADTSVGVACAERQPSEAFTEALATDRASVVSDVFVCDEISALADSVVQAASEWCTTDDECVLIDYHASPPPDAPQCIRWMTTPFAVNGFTNDLAVMRADLIQLDQAAAACGTCELGTLTSFEPYCDAEGRCAVDFP